MISAYQVIRRFYFSLSLSVSVILSVTVSVSVALSLSLSLSSCSTDIPVKADVGYGYFPIDIGHWVIYDVDSTSLTTFDTNYNYFHFKIKEVVESDFIDLSGRVTQRIERYVKFDSTDWVIKDVWYWNRTKTTAEVVAENDRYIKLAFPVRLDASWNGNAFNTIGERDYKYMKVDEPMNIGLLQFDSTCTVQYNLSLITMQDYATEKYAKNIGKIYGEYLNYQLDVSTGHRVAGYEYKMTINSYSR